MSVITKRKSFLPFFREAQSQFFFAKHGFSLLGVLAVYQGCNYYYDIVIDGYVSQDSLQVQAAIFLLRKIVRDGFRPSRTLFFKMIMQLRTFAPTTSEQFFN